MEPIHSFTVIPSLPPALVRLRWAWNHDASQLFRQLDDELWESTGHNPVLLLGTIDWAKLGAAVEDESFLAHLRRVWEDFDAYLAAGFPGHWDHALYSIQMRKP